MNLEGITLNIQKNFLSGKLFGARVDKVFQPSKLALVLQLRTARENTYLYLTAANNAPHMRTIAKNTINPENPPAFCMLLRKHLENGRITNVYQYGLDRVVIFAIDTIGIGDSIVTKKLIVELTGKNSNIILVQDDTIIDCIKHVGSNENKLRQMLPQRPYLPPPEQTGLDILQTGSRQIAENIKKMPGTLSAAIVKATLGLGPFTAKEIAFRAGLPNDMKAEQLDEHDISALSEAIDSIVIPVKENTQQMTLAINEQNKLLALTPYLPEHLKNIQTKTCKNINEAIDYAVNLQQTAPPESLQLLKFAKNESARAQKKLEILKAEYEQAVNADHYKNIADNLMANLHLLEKGMTTCSCTDFLTNEQLAIELQDDLTPIENAQRYYKTYNKAKRAVQHLEEQIKASVALLAYLETIEFSLQNISTKDELAEIKNELKTVGLLQEKNSKTTKSQQSAPIKITLPSQSIVYIGKNNKQNDLLTFKIAKANDIWLHAKDIPGSHVILQSSGKTADNEELLTAAALAGWFSKARNSSNIPVDYTLKKHVKKPSGSKPGFVIYEQQKTVYITPDEEQINSLMK